MAGRRRRQSGAIYFGLTIILIGLIIALVIGLIRTTGVMEAEKDPHEGQVYIYDGYDWIWMTPLEGVAVNELTEEKFSSDTGRVEFIGEGYEVQRGIDVSEHQRDIDWQAVKAAGIDYAYIRLGWRGYTEGGIFEDAYYHTNMQGAAGAGLPLGVYFFSQAISVEEAIEEADYVLERVGEYELSLPIVFDWEKVDDESARTNGFPPAELTDCAIAFCERIKQAGYTPCIYFNRILGYYGYELQRLTDYDIWSALPELGFPSFYYKFSMWQYSCDETVPGVEGPCDMNLRFIKIPPAVPEGTEGAEGTETAEGA